MRTHEWGPVGDVGQLTPGTLFYVFLDGATHLAMKVEAAGDHEELSYYCAVLSPQWGGKNAAPCLIHEKTVSSLPVLMLPNAVLIPFKPRPNENPPTAGQLVKTTEGLVLTVIDIRGMGYTSFVVETGEVLKSRPQRGFVYFHNWKIALPSPLRSGRWDVILEWPARGGDNGVAGA
jgi:hypothetical protein